MEKPLVVEVEEEEEEEEDSSNSEEDAQQMPPPPPSPLVGGLEAREKKTEKIKQRKEKLKAEIRAELVGVLVEKQAMPSSERPSFLSLILNTAGLLSCALPSAGTSFSSYETGQRRPISERERAERERERDQKKYSIEGDAVRVDEQRKTILQLFLLFGGDIDRMGEVLQMQVVQHLRERKAVTRQMIHIKQGNDWYNQANLLNKSSQFLSSDLRVREKMADSLYTFSDLHADTVNELQELDGLLRDNQELFDREGNQQEEERKAEKSTDKKLRMKQIVSSLLEVDIFSKMPPKEESVPEARAKTEKEKERSGEAMTN